MGGTGQARQSRHAASQIDRRGSARVRRATAVEHRRARTPPVQWSSSVDITSIPARTWSATSRSEAQIGRDSAVDEEPEDSSRSRHRPRGAERRPAFGSFEEVSSGTVVSARPELHPIRWRLARLAIDRASRKRDMAASMWLVRCGCRRRSKATAAPALVGRGDCRGSLCRRAPPCPTWAMAAADRSWVTTPMPVRPPDKTVVLWRSVVKGV